MIQPLLCLICGLKICSNENHEKIHCDQFAFINTETTVISLKFKDSVIDIDFAYNDSLGKNYEKNNFNFEDFTLNKKLISKIQNIIVNNKIPEMIFIEEMKEINE